MDSPDDAIQKGFVLDEAEPTGVADIDLQNNKKIATIVSYSLSSSRDTGCDNNGIVLYDRSKNKIDQSGLEDQLHSIPSDCVGAAAYPITVNGKIYIESDHGNENNNIMPGEAKGIGIYTLRDDHLITICAVENHMVFTAQ